MIRPLLRPARSGAIFLLNTVRLRTRSVDLDLRLSGPVLVLGSAPQAVIPKSFSNDWSLITVNASQAVAERFGIVVPDVTFIQPFVIAGTSSANISARAQLRGRHTHHLVGIDWGWYKGNWAEDLCKLNYTYDKLTIIDSIEQARAVYEATGLYSGIRSSEGRMSTGLAAAIFALRSGADPIVLAGFSLSRNGHAYDNGSSRREHVQGDRAVLAELIRRGCGVFAADPAFAKETRLESFL
jgi:hypothetical protein